MPLAPPWRRKQRLQRERLGHESPGVVLRGPPIAVTCKCGEKRDLRYGEAWTCEQCGRHWDTAQIPAEQYGAIRRTQLRFRVLPVVYGLVVVGVALFFPPHRQHLLTVHPAAGGHDGVVLLHPARPPPALSPRDRGAPTLEAPPPE